MKSIIKSPKTSLLALSCAVALGLGACAPTVSIRGNMLENHQLEEIKAGVSTRSDVLRTLGSPTTQSTFDNNVWYYIGQETEKKGILDPKITKERIVMVAFDPEGIVQEARDVDRAHMDVPYVRDKTATHGNETSVMQQFFGNLGKFNPNTENK